MKNTLLRKTAAKVPLKGLATYLGYVPGAAAGFPEFEEAFKEHGWSASSEAAGDYSKAFLDTAAKSLLYNPVTLLRGIKGFSSSSADERTKGIRDLLTQKGLGGGMVGLSNYLEQSSLSKEKLQKELDVAKLQEKATQAAAQASIEQAEVAKDLSKYLPYIGIGLPVASVGALLVKSYQDKKQREFEREKLRIPQKIQEVSEPVFEVKLNNPLRQSPFDPTLKVPLGKLPISHQKRIRARLRDASRYL